MIPDRNFLHRCAHKNNLSLSRELEDWLLVHFEDEPYEDFNTLPSWRTWSVCTVNLTRTADWM